MPADVSAALPFSSGRREISALDVFIELSLTELQWAEVSAMALLTLSEIRSSPTRLNPMAYPVKHRVIYDKIRSCRSTRSVSSPICR